MSKVILHQVKTFDAKNGYNFIFSYSGAENINGNILRIYKFSNPETPIIIQKQLNTKMNILSPSTAELYKLINGEKYIATVTVCDENNDEINLTVSDKVIFYCFASPTLSIKPVPEIINASSFIVELQYDYDKTGSYADKLNEYKVLVYSSQNDKNQIELYETKRAYATDLNNLLAYITDLEGGKSYYLKAVGTTIHEVSVESKLIQINIADNTQYLRTAFNAKVDNDTASVYLTSNLINIDGESDGNVDFKNGKIIIEENSTVYFNKNISVYNTTINSNAEYKNNSFMLSVKFADFPIDSDILVLKNSVTTSTITLSAASCKTHYLSGETIRNTNGYLKLTAIDKTGETTIISDPIELNFVNNNDICKVELLVIIQRIHGGYTLKVKIV